MSIRKTKKKTRETTSIGSLAGQFSKNFASGKFVVICILHALSVSHEKTCLIGTCHSQVSQTTVEVGRCWEKRGTKKVWDNQDTSKMNGYITTSPPIRITPKAWSFFNAIIGVSIPEQSVATRIHRGGAIPDGSFSYRFRGVR